MPTNSNLEKASAYQSIQVLLLIFSFIFFFVIAYGYFYLVVKSGWFPAFVAGITAASFAWFLARVVGTSDGGVRSHPFLFLWLLLISATGVYNSLMLNFEGDRILADAASSSQERFAQLQTAAESKLAESGEAARVNRIQSLREALFSEIRNPANCGQGPASRRIISDLQRELPGFTPLSRVEGACERNEEVIRDYRERIDGLIARLPGSAPELLAITGEAGRAREQLGAVRSTVTSSYNPGVLRDVLTRYDNYDALYRNLRFRLSRHADTRGVPEGLNLLAVQSLGNALKLPALIFDRLDQIVTWAFLGVAVAFDFLMVHLFRMARLSRVRRPRPGAALSGAW